VLNLAEGDRRHGHDPRSSSTWRMAMRERSVARWISRMRRLADREQAGACAARSRAGLLWVSLAEVEARKRRTFRRWRTGRAPRGAPDESMALGG
jgi:hypothetical protein